VDAGKLMPPRGLVGEAVVVDVGTIPGYDHTSNRYYVRDPMRGLLQAFLLYPWVKPSLGVVQATVGFLRLEKIDRPHEFLSELGMVALVSEPTPFWQHLLSDYLRGAEIPQYAIVTDLLWVGTVLAYMGHVVVIRQEGEFFLAEFRR